MVLTLLAIGCAHEAAYKRGTRLSEQAQFDRAIEELETAVRLAEDKNSRKAAQRYRERLEEVKQQAGRFFYQEAEIRFKQADLGTAQGLIEKCVKYCPQEQTYWSFRQRVLQAITDAEQVRAEALALAEQRQWDQALQRMNEALAMYRTLPGGDGDLRQIRDRAYRYHVDRAQERLRQDDLAGAETEAQAALHFQEGGRDAEAVVQAVADRREAAQLITRGRTSLEQGDSEEALRALERANRLHPAHPDLPELLGRARRAVCDLWLEQGRQAMQAGDYPAALRLFRKSRDLLDGYGGVGTLLNDAQSRLAELHLEGSRQYERDGANGLAVLHAAIALGYQLDSPEARRQLGQCTELLREEVHYTIGFAGFRAPPQHSSLAAMLGSTALEYLTRIRPANVTLVERSDLQAILDEQDLSTSQRIDPQHRTPTGQLHGVDALLVGQVIDSGLTTESKCTGHGESIYQDGYRTEPNPDHVHAAAGLDATLHALERARQNLAEAEARLARYKHIDPANTAEVARRHKAQAEVDEAKQRLVNTAADVGTARLRLASIPREVLVPNMIKHEYPIETFTRTAKVTFMLKMLDAATGEVLLAERIEGRHDVSDRVISADPQRNVPEDPLEFAADGSLLEAAANAAIPKLKQALTTACTKHGQRFASEMHRAEAAGDTIRAINAAMKYLFAYPTAPSEGNAVTDSLRSYLADEGDLLDVAALLRTHCHVLAKK